MTTSANVSHPVAGSWPVLTKIETGIVRLVELAAAALVVVEVGVLSAGVVARYAWGEPLVWSDELASMLFLWLSMMGAVLAFHRGQHMRMSAIADAMAPATRARLEVASLVFCLAVCVLLLPKATTYAIHEIPVVTPAMEISVAWRSFGLPIGLGLMVLLGVMDAVRRIKLTDFVVGVLIAVCIIGLALAAKPLILAMGNWNLVLFFVVFIALGVLSGVPIAFVFALAAISYVAIGTSRPLTVIAGRLDEGMSHLLLLAVPLFVLLGMLMELTGMARAMVNFLASLLGHVRGGLCYVLVAAMYLVSGISGSKTADMAAVAPALFPEMKARGSKPGDLVALLAATGAQTETIPPSLVLITIGSVTSVSISALFIGGLLPALVCGLMLCVVVWWRYRNEDMSGFRKAPRKEIFRAFLISLPALALPFIIRTAVVEGVATATEVSTIGIAYSVLIGLLIYRQFDLKRVGPMLVDTAVLSGAILFIIAAATAVAWCLTQSGFSRGLVEAMGGLPGGAPMFMFVSIVAFIILGSVLEGIPAVVLFAPLVFPIAKGLGIHDVHYSMVVILAMGVGLFLPPFGVGYYAACAIGRVNPAEGIKPLWGYMVALLLGLALVAMVPWISIGFL
ncbi:MULTISPECIES: TRAP transporter large permease [Ensifer]|jgi:tripartite ATP-independent transporter DctM subunit|uniref:TRAP transporter large permease n=1 Tax=Ensifer TaxID=106591 RepID=UPI0007125A0E|nr:MULTISPECIES: TRAP transporter large permease subunit [Ensifer]KQX51308.1 ABC transporter permease [Ensifer sp. Root1298]KQX83673.1 ABC transporter permease [Ensifer sp. Root1312]KRC20018.1 ABC transporter permease [Ensifer sp. Root74]KRD63265.1 ABC transporter permease [Ensifer sp. Root954]